MKASSRLSILSASAANGFTPVRNAGVPATGTTRFLKILSRRRWPATIAWTSALSLGWRAGLAISLATAWPSLRLSLRSTLRSAGSLSTP